MISNGTDVKTMPKVLTKYGASDYAVTEDDGDYTVHGVAGVDQNDDLYIIDWWYGQEQADVWIEEQLDLIKKHRPIMWVGESGVIRRSVEPFLLKRANERHVYTDFQWLPSITDKPTRARSFQGRVAMKKVFLPLNTDWATRLYKMMMRFPAGAVDDDIDVLSLFGRILDQTFAAYVPKKNKKKNKDPYEYEEYEENEEDSWRTA